MTLTVLAPFTTWLLVTMIPFGSTMKPEPRGLDRLRVGVGHPEAGDLTEGQLRLRRLVTAFLGSRLGRQVGGDGHNGWLHFHHEFGEIGQGVAGGEGGRVDRLALRVRNGRRLADVADGEASECRARKQQGCECDAPRSALR